jgi:glycosyltransferase involved in cell wall biosynthesis
VSKPRVLYDATLAVNPAGTGTFVRGLLEGLKAQADIEILTSAFESTALSALDTDRRGLAARLRNSLRHLDYYLNVLPRRAEAMACDIIYCPSSLVPLRGRRPFLTTVFDLTQLTFSSTQDRLSGAYARAMLRRGLARATAFCTISRAVRAELTERFANIRPERVHVTYPGPNPHLLAAAAVPAAIPDRPFVLMVGTVEPRKNHLTMLRALAEHVTRRPGSGLTLVAAGSAGWRYQPVLRAMDELGLRDRVVRLGPVDPGALKWLYQHARALAFPSLYEGFGLPVLEALYLQCPVVASRIPSVVEIIGDDGRLLEPGNVSAWATALDELIDGPRDAAGLAAGLERARRFTWDACARSAVEAIYAALGSRRLAADSRSA